jgi:REP element-mobilizing transposase RayT
MRFGNIENDIMHLNEYGQIASNEWLKLTNRFPNMQMDVFQIMPDHMHAIICLKSNEIDRINSKSSLQTDLNQNDETTLNILAPNDFLSNDFVSNDVAINDVEQNVVSTNVVEQNVDLPNDIATNDIATNDIATNDFATNDIATNDIAPNNFNKGTEASPVPTVSEIIGAYKSLVANGCLKIFKSKNEKMGKLWQPNYYEHIIRNDHSYQKISEYILNNPSKWTRK